VGPSPEDETIFAALGVGGFGIQVAPAIGRLVAEWIVDGAPSCIADHELLLPGRSALRAPGDDIAAKDVVR
jgi:glycine/D-amino acid oxidase-like deaminating enzyme